MADKRRKRVAKVRRRAFGTVARPRLCVFRGLKNISAQLIDDENGVTLIGASTLSKEYRKRHGMKGFNREAAHFLGQLLAEKAAAKGIENVVFDRRNYAYHGRLKAVAEGAREGGLKF